MGGQAVYPAFRKVLTALLARVRIAVAVVVELGAPDEVLKDEGIGLAAHCALRSVVSASPATVSVRVLSALIPPNTNTGSPEDLGVIAGLRAQGWDLVMGLCRGSDSAFPDRQISYTACSVGLVVYPTRVLICAQAIGRNPLKLSYVHSKTSLLLTKNGSHGGGLRIH